MALFSRTTTSPDSTRTRPHPLPEGHDDAESPSHVPEYLHDAWIEHAGTGLVEHYGLLQNTMRVIAEHELRQLRYPEQFDGSVSHVESAPDGNGGTVSRRVIQRAPRHLLARAAELGAQNVYSMSADAPWMQQALPAHINEHSERIREEAQHAIRLRAVLDAYEANEANKESQRRTERKYLCPQCGSSDKTNGTPVVRELFLHSGSGKAIKLVSCAACYFTALGILIERAGLALVGEASSNTTRREVVEAVLARLTTLGR